MRSEELLAPLKIDGHALSWLDNIEEGVETFWDRPLLPHYTNHGIDHSQRITKALADLLEDFPGLLKQRERFILLASIYLHDIGMQSPQHAGLPKKTEYTREEMERIREVHNESSAQMIKESIVPESELSLGFEKCKDYAKYIAEVSRYHRVLDLTELDNTAIGGEPVRLQLLAALLRLGDALDADYRRVNMDYLSLREIPVESKYHWWCHHYVQSVLIQKGHIELYFRIPEKYKNSKVIVVIEKRIRESVSEALSNVYDILDNHEIRLYPSVEIRSVEFLPEGSLQAIPDDLCEFIDVHVLKTVERSEQESARTGLVWYADGVPFSDDADVVKCLGEVFGLVEEERYMDAAEKIVECRVLTMTPKDKMIFLIVAGNCYYFVGRLNDARDYYEDALKLCERKDLQEVFRKDIARARCVVFGNIGLVCRIKGHLDEALKYHKKGLEISRQIGYRKEEANELNHVGSVYLNKRCLHKSLRYLEDALKIDREIGYKQGEAIALGNIGLVCRIKGHLDEALKYHKRALEIDREIGYKQGEADQLGNIGLVCRIKGHLDEALKYHKRALEIDREIGYKQGEAVDMGNIGIICRAKGDFDQALKHLENALEIHRRVGYKQGEAEQLGNIGLIFMAKGDLGQAMKYLEDALEILMRLGLTYGRQAIEDAIRDMKNKD